MEHLQLDLEVLTPAFTSGADQGEAEVPAATMRGMLRWWWRALNSGVSIETLKMNEGRLFGSSEMKMKSPLRVTVGEMQIPKGARIKETRISDEVLRYLGYGLWNSNPRRKAIPPGTVFSLGLDWRPGVFDEMVVTELVQTASAWVTLGGVGSRSRRGWGALNLKNISGSVSGFSEEQLADLWSSSCSQWMEVGSKLAEIPLWPGLASRRVHIGVKKSSAPDALEAVGEVYRAKKRAKVIPSWIGGETSRNARRASSILISVVRDGEGYRGVITLLPCLKDSAGNGEDEMRQFAEEFSQWRIL